MANINLAQESYIDYIGSLYFNACNVANVKFTPKVVKVDGKDVVLVHISGVQKSTGVVVNTDIWSRNDATDADIKALPKSFDDIEFRIGYWPKVDENGDTILMEGRPKMVAYYKGTERIVFEGEKREYEG